MPECKPLGQHAQLRLPVLNLILDGPRTLERLSHAAHALRASKARYMACRKQDLGCPRMQGPDRSD